MFTGLKSIPEDAVYTSLKSPVGELWLVASKRGLHALLWRKDAHEPSMKRVFARLKRDEKHPILRKTLSQLKEYFSGKRKSFDLPLAPGGTEFQMQAWQELRKIPYGQTLSYAEQAARVGDKKKARAVGTANSRNPISIIVPCHRVIAKSGALSGFGGGVSVKKFLLDLERGASI